MKIDPKGDFDKKVFNFLREIEYKRKEANSNQVFYSIRIKPINLDKYKDQLLIDRLVKQKVIEVIDVVDVVAGKAKLYEAIQFEIKILLPKFDLIYNTYRNIFETDGSNKLIIKKNGEVSFTCDGVEYLANFKPKSNLFNVLLKLAEKSGDSISVEELNKEMKRSKLNSNNDDSVERVSDAIKNIKKKLKYKGKLLIKSEYHNFRLLPSNQIIS